MAKTGRPPIEINQKQFETLCGIQCTLSEIAAVFACSEDTVERWAKKTYELPFADVYKKFASVGKSSLRRYQFELAKRNAAMAIWLGKQYLGQRDMPEVDDPENLKRAREILGEIESAIN